MKSSPIRMGGVQIDTENASMLADFYCQLLRWHKIKDEDGWAVIESPEEVVVIGFQTVENYRRPVWPWQADEQHQMMHFDFTCDNLEAAIAHALDCGAAISEVQFFEECKVMLDPSGHPFCICAAA